MSSLIHRLVDFGYGVQYEQIPAAATIETKRILLDSVGCALASLGVDKGRMAVKAGRELGTGPEARIIGGGEALSVFGATFVNGELINGLDMDVLTIPPGHVTPYILPAILATAEKNSSSGKKLLIALTVAHEVSHRFGRAMGYYRDVQPGQKLNLPSISGFSSTVFGGTLGTALVQGLDRSTTANAMGLVGHMAPTQSMSKWGHTVPGSDNKYLMSGWIGQAQLLSVMLASIGYRGDAEVLEGDFGFWRYMGAGKWNGLALTDRLGDVWQFPDATIYKVYPHCRNTHTILDCLYSQIRQHDLRPEEIEKVTTYSDSHTATLPLYSTKTIRTPSDAQMSTAWAVAMAVHRVPIGRDWHTDETLANQEFHAFLEKVEGHAHPDFEAGLLDDPQSRIGRIEIKARGQIFTEERRFRKGSPATPETYMTDEDIVAKFRRNAKDVLPDETAERVTRMVFGLEDLGDINELTRLW
jgi:2-methylcitrate dehydratase PrpD